MTVHIQVDLPAIEQAPSASGAEGISVRDHLAGLLLMFHYVWTKRSDQATRELLMGWFAVGPEQVDRLAAGLIAFGHLERRGEGWRIKGAGRYVNLRKAFSEGGKKSKGNLKQYQQPAAPAATSSSESGPEAPSSPAPKRALSAQEQCWDYLEHLRVEHCRKLGLEPGATPRPKLCNSKLNEACAAAGILDQIIEDEAVTRWDLLPLLFELYLAQDRLGLKDKDGNACTPPWPIHLFLSVNVLTGFKREWDEEQAA